MGSFVFIFINIIVPVFIQIALGYSLQKKFNLQVGTLSKAIFYVFLPSLLFAKIYEAEISKEIFIKVVLHSFIVFVLLFLISWLVAKLKKYPKTLSKAFINSVCFYNGGNYCLPIIQLLYNDPFAISIQVITIMAQNIISNTVGIFNSSSGSKDTKQALISVLKVPMAYSIVFALLLKVLNIKLWTPIWSSIDILSQGLVPLALFTLGAQLATTSFNFLQPKIYLSNFIRLIASPILAYLVTLALGLQGLIAQVMIISAAAPTAVNTVLMAIEFDNEPDFASQTVFSATVFSAVTVTMVIYLVTNFI
ncbi:MAG: malate permease [Clostridiales bacterium]|nr:malate permease [Clostridiales bacterium]MDK2933655.1 malate permease [Clostridiales bacterium]